MAPAPAGYLRLSEAYQNQAAKADAIQVADRWHLWHNLGDAVERAVPGAGSTWPQPW